MTDPAADEPRAVLPQPGAAPGALVIAAGAQPPVMRLMAYGPDGLEEHGLLPGEERHALESSRPVTWINVDGLGDEGVLRSFAETFGIHRLTLEDIVSLGQRAKAEQFPDRLFLVARMPRASREGTEQVSFFIGPNFVLTFQEREGDCFDGVRRRLREGKGKLRSAGSDYLAYALLDAVVDSYFPQVEFISEELEALEDDVFQRPSRETMEALHRLKRWLVVLRRAAAPHRELINSLLRDESTLIDSSTQIYLRDCYDHAIRVQELLDSYREMASDLMNSYLSSVSNRMNEIMKVLTIIATIFIPLGFIAGLYGMNFNPEISAWNMPELNWTLGYPFALTLMGGLAAALVIYFWRKGWFG